MATIYVFTSIGAADSCPNVHMPIRQKPNLSTTALYLTVAFPIYILQFLLMLLL